MIDLSTFPSAGPHVHAAPSDPGPRWVRDAGCAIDAPPDNDLDPRPDARWPASAPRTGQGGVVAPRIVALAGGGFRMYYTQILPRVGFPAGAVDYSNATSRILSASSADGAAWSPEPGIRLSAKAGGAGEFRVVSSDVVPVAGSSGALRMYYECAEGPQSAGNSIRSAISQDGLAWTPEAGVRLAGPGRNFMAPRILFLADGRRRLFCCERGRGIISALDDGDGLTFREEAGVRVAPGGPNDAQSAFASDFMRVGDRGYVMFYAGYSAPNRAQILRAISDDGLTWSKDPVPLIMPGRDDPQAVKCSEMCLLRLPQPPGAPPRYRMFYESCDGTAANERGVWRIVSATSI